jgi:hypothetical protein
MSTRLTVELVCDARRAPGCYRTYAARGGAAPAVVLAVRREAERAGWTREAGTGPLLRDDVCPACRAGAPSGT